jgi:hypothetical protein
MVSGFAVMLAAAENFDLATMADLGKAWLVDYKADLV